MDWERMAAGLNRGAAADVGARNTTAIVGNGDTTN